MAATILALMDSEWFAIAVFLTCWLGYSFIIDISAFSTGALTKTIAARRKAWMRAATTREHIISDTNIIRDQVNGALFFASAALLAIGMAVSLITNRFNEKAIFGQADDILVAELQWLDWKLISLLLLFVYVFFKFAWSYRLYIYTGITLGTLEASETEAERANIGDQAARVNIQAAKHFNLGQRGFSFSVALIAWLFGNEWLIVASIGVALTLLRRQLLSKTLYILKQP